MSLLEQLGAYVAGGVREAVGDDTRRAVRLHVADTVGAWIAGARSSEGKALVRFARDPGTPGGGRESALDRLMLNCAVTRLSEIDDIHLGSGTTPGSVIVPAALTLAATSQDGGQAAIEEAIVSGYDAMVRLGLTIDGPKALYRGIWPTYFTAAFGTAAVASRLLGLDPGRAAHALAMALACAAPNVGHQGGASMSRWLLLGHAARSGAMAAFAARAGFTGDVQLLDKDFLTSVYGITPRAEAFSQGLGAVPALAGVSFKPWCAARQTIAASQAIKEIAGMGVSPADIEAVTVCVPPPYLRMVNHGVVKGDRSSHLTSAPYQVAQALCAPEAAYAVEHPASEIPPALGALMSKVTVQADDSLLEHFPATWPARVAVTAKGARHEKLVLHVPGDPQRPFGETDIGDKFHRVIAPLIGADRSARVLARALAGGQWTALAADTEALY